MKIPLRKLVFSVIFNSSLFFILIISVQNSSKTSKVDLLINETIKLPISFIIGVSFLSGSITGSLISLTSQKEN